MTPESLPNRFDHAEAQPRLYAEWESHKFFHAEPDDRPVEKRFTIVIPPPNVTGALHLGHALNNTLQDIQIRMHRMQGFNTLWMPGTDHAGIATQAVVERRIREDEGKTRHDLGRDKLVERIWQWKEQYEPRIIGQLKQMGCSCDWDRTRFTLDPGCANAVRRTFFDLFQKGLIYRGKRLVNWDTFLQTAVSDDEVFQEKVKGKFWHFKYPVIDPQPGEPTHVEIATTRPETMLGDTAVAVHPDPAKALNDTEAELRERLAKAPAKEKDAIQEQIGNIQQRRTDMLPLLAKLRDMALAGRKLMLPLQDREIPLIADTWAKPELGTGAVKITPAHDPNDYAVWERNKAIGLVNILNPDGTLNDAAGKYKGLRIMQAREKVVADLDALSLVGDIEDREIELPHSDRSKTPIEPYLADQWFVKMDQLAQSAMDAVSDGRVKIYPERYAKSYLDWLGEKRDWPVSRQLWWGHRVPVNRVVVNYGSPGSTAQVQQARQKLEKAVSQYANAFGISGDLAVSSDPSNDAIMYICAGTDAAQNELSVFCERHNPQTQLPPNLRYLPISETAKVAADTELKQSVAVFDPQDPDVLDTWFSSALWPHSTLGWPEQTKELAYYYPTSTLITSRDIITLWVARMVLTGLNNVGDVPFREVFIHPKILDGYGETMSKSKGNGVDPLDIVDKFGADALRFGLARLCTETQDVRMPVQFECPHCEYKIDQTKQNRELPKIKCSKCGKEFATQWARTDADKALPRAAVVSERFEEARNFTSKLWNAARFALINLQGYVGVPPSGGTGPAKAGTPTEDLTTEDRWILSRLATVTKDVTHALRQYHYADAAKTLYDFAWDEFCSFYIEMAKPRLQDEATRAHSQRVLAYVLDGLLRLLHPMMPFVTEEIWQLLNQMAPARGLAKPASAPPWLIVAPWPRSETERIDPTIESRFRIFQQALAALREIRDRQKIKNNQRIEFSIRCDESTAELLMPMLPYLASMTNAQTLGLGLAANVPKTHAKTALPGMEIFVDLKDFIDKPAEIAKNEKLKQQLIGLIKGKESKLGNESFVARAPTSVVEAERAALAQAQEQLRSVEEQLAGLRSA
jgi:valyl-tRNA synthetase